MAGIFAAALDGIFVLSPVRDADGRIEDFRVVLANPRAEQISGRQGEALVGARVRDLLPGSRAAGLHDLFARVVEEGEAAVREGRYDADGLSGWFHLSCAPLDDGLAVTVRDVTAQWQAREEQATTRALLEQVLAASLDGVSVMEALRDASGRVVDFVYRISNPQVERLTGVRREDRIGHRYLELYPQAREAGLFDRFVQVVETGEPVQFEASYPGDPLSRRLFISATRVADGVALTFHDVTAAEQREQALREREARFRLMAENSLDIVTEHALDGTPVYVSPAIEHVLGYKPEDVVGRDNNHLIHPDDARAMREAEAAREGPAPTEGTIQYRVRHRDGHYVWIELSGRVVFDEAGNPTGLVTTARDVTARKEVETALQARNRELQEFAYAASHDLQEPLRKIRAFADLLLADYREALPEEARGYLDRMQAATARMSGFIRDLLALSRVSTRGGAFEPVEPGRLLAEVLSDLEIILQETDARVEAGALPALRADPMQIRQLFQNLIGNAVKFHRQGVRPLVQVRGRVEHAGPVGEQVVFEVQDNGIGFEERFLDRIFAPFQRLHARERYEGSGIGLAICRRIAERHGGTLSARSVPGQGSTFIVTFPRTPPDRGSSEIAASAP